MYSINSKLKKWLIALLAVTMAVMVALTCACSDDSTSDDDDDDDDTETAVEATDYQTITNGDFEFGTFEYEADAYPDSTPNGWTLSTESSITSSTSSTSTSGIIDTAETDSDGNAVFANLDEDDRILDITSTDDEVKYYNPRTPYYYGLFDIAEDKEYDEDDEDLRVNPNLKGTKILKISNVTSSGNGTAQYFTSSSSLTIPQNQYAKLTIWVQTYNLTSNFDLSKTGAYISLTETVNGTTYENLLVDNINTNGYWTLLEFYIEGSDFASTTISSLRLGLGHGNGSQTSRYVEGNAFFDNISFEVFETSTEYDAVVTTFNGKFSEDDKIKFDNSQFVYSSDLYDLSKTDNLDKYTTVQFKLSNYTIKNDLTLADQAFTGSYEYSNIFIDAGNTVDIEVGNEIGGDNGVYEDTDLFNPTGKCAKFVFDNPSSAHFISNALDLAAGEYKLLVFYTKLKITNPSTNGASISIIEEAGFAKNTKTSVISSVTETSSDEDDVTEFGYWNQYKIVVYNATNEATQFKLAFLFGLDDDSTSTKLDYTNDLPTGYFVVSTLQTATLTEDDYNLLEADDTNVFKVTTNGKYTVYTEDDEDDESADSYSIGVGSAQQSQLQLGLVEPSTTYNFIGDETKTEHGVFNTEYVDKYMDAADANLLKTLKDGSNKYVQALLLNNKEATTSSFVQSFDSISASSIEYITVTLKAFGDAKAYVYLASKDHEDETYQLLEIAVNDTTTKTFTKAITSSTDANTADGWITVTFLIETGDEAKDFRIEVANGSRDGATTSTGMVAIKEITSSSVSDLTFDQYLYNYTTAYTSWEEGKYALQGTDEIYFENAYVTFASYDTIDVTEEDEDEDEEEEEEDEEEEEEADEDKTYTVDKSAFLQVSSIILAAALLVAIIGIVVRMLIVKNKKKKKTVQELYNRNSRDAVNEKIAQKKAAQKKDENVEVEEVEETTEDYNYDEAQNVEETTETTVEETPTEEEKPSDDEILEEVVEEVSNNEADDDNKQE